MAEGPRITESGLDSRVTESGDTRVTEGFFTGFVSLAAAGTIAAVASAVLVDSADLSATGSKLFAGVGEFQGLTELNATGTLVSEATRERFSEASLSAEGSVAATFIRETPGSTSLSADGTLAADAFFRIDGDTSLTASSSVAFDGDARLEGLFRTFISEATRITGSEDTRITEAGDTRITSELFFNTGVGGAVVTGVTKIDFDSVPYYKRDGIWEPFIPFVKYEGVWQEPVAMYKKESGAWKRIY